ncbi:MAG: WecB/TagA/CpsF family glycosyltransferase [Eubacterium sp.]|nr:WecB/TagA/CpsF family glycosyltransferase [Eubacterium sp.]
MVKKIRLIGMEMDNFTLQEEMIQSETFYDRQELNIIRTVSLRILSLAADSQAVREGIRQADLLVVGDREILTEAGIYSSRRLREASEHGFMREFLSRMISRRSSFFLIAKNQENLEHFREFLSAEYENMMLVGNYLLDGCSGDYDMMVNEINAAAPDVVLSVLPSPQEDTFLLREKEKIRARVWYSLSTDYKNLKKKPSFLFWFQQLIHRGRFKNAVHHYEDRHE